jgi:hypothetical protein
MDASTKEIEEGVTIIEAVGTSLSEILKLQTRFTIKQEKYPK